MMKDSYSASGNGGKWKINFFETNENLTYSWIYKN